MEISKILFIIPSLEYGGAEKQLVTLLSCLDLKRFDPVIVTYYSGGLFENLVLNIPGVTLHCLNMKTKLNSLYLLFNLAKIIQKEQPDILYGFLGDACTLALLHSKIGHKKKSIMGLRSTKIDFTCYSRMTKIIYYLNAFLSKYADRIICNSRSGFAYHKEQGYAPQKMKVIANGIDIQYFKFQFSKREQLRQEWQIPSDSFIIGRVGRLDPMKDYPTFLTAAAAIINSGYNVYFVIVGKGPAQMFDELKSMCENLGIANYVLWLSQRDDLPDLYNAFDLSTSTSVYEGSPNVIAESLACQIPCVATDVGDSSRILGPGGICVPAKNPKKLAAAWEQLLLLSKTERDTLGRLGRKHISDNYSVQQMVKKTEKTFCQVLQIPSKND